MDKPIAYVTQENPQLNYVPAEAFGEVQFLTRDDYSPIKGSLHNAHLVSELRAKIKKFDPSKDFMVMSGSPIITGLVFMLLREVTDKLTVLRWSNRDHQYQPIELDIR